MKFAICLMLAMVFGLAGCGGDGMAVKQNVKVVAGVPAPLELTLWSSSAKGRYVYYELGRDGMLSFGGGSDAIGRVAKDVAVLSDDQIRAIWQSIQDGNLMNAENRSFTKREVVKYSMKIRAGDTRHHFGNVDEAVPGVAPLDALLFEYQAQIRYRDAFKPIEERIEKSGGAVEKKR